MSRGGQSLDQIKSNYHRVRITSTSPPHFKWRINQEHTGQTNGMKMEVETLKQDNCNLDQVHLHLRLNIAVCVQNACL